MNRTRADMGMNDWGRWHDSDRNETQSLGGVVATHRGLRTSHDGQAREARAHIRDLFGRRMASTVRRRMGLPLRVARVQSLLRGLAEVSAPKATFERLTRALEQAVARAGFDFPPLGFLLGDMLLIVERNGGQAYIQRRWVGWSTETFQRWAIDGQSVGPAYRAYPVYRSWFQGSHGPLADARYSRVGNYFGREV